ncbi:hypothetical protein K438DRAFT_1808048 [Mycena galopus ATCC 62051]|nr:hypothetical protein K438DRAFT_1808048 [Mycena galopus ATCC 62051]
MPRSPSLPLELEKEIFELCALSRRVSIPKLMLVAQHVKQWVEPLLYRTILLGVDLPGVPILSYHIVPSIISRKPPAFFHRVVRHLLAHGSTHHDPARELGMILRLCTGVEILYADFKSMPPSSSHMFSRLTYLHLVVRLDENMDSVQAFVAALSTLTHLSFSFDMYENDESVFVMIHRMLESSPLLRVLVIFDDSIISWAHKVPSHVRRDVRFMLMPGRDLFADWYAGGANHWSDAETFIVKRRTGEINPLKHLWS